MKFGTKYSRFRTACSPSHRYLTPSNRYFFAKACGKPDFSSFALTTISLRLLDRRKATKGLALKTLVQRGDEDKMLKCLLMMDDT